MSDKTYSAVITAQKSDGEVQVPAFVFGSWAVHHTIGSRDPRDWTITNVPTGMAIPREYTEYLDKKTAIAVARVLDAKIGERRVTRKVGELIVYLIWRVSTGKEIK